MCVCVRAGDHEALRYTPSAGTALLHGIRVHTHARTRAHTHTYTHLPGFTVYECTHTHTHVCPHMFVCPASPHTFTIVDLLFHPPPLPVVACGNQCLTYHVYMHVCVRVHACMRAYVCVLSRVHACVHACLCVSVRVCACVAHGDRCLTHEGREVTEGFKYLLRSDIVYSMQAPA